MAGDGGMVPAGLTKVLEASPRGMYRPNRSSERLSMWCELQAKGGAGNFIIERYAPYDLSVTGRPVQAISGQN